MAEEGGQAERAAWFLALVAEAQPHLTGPESATWMERLDREHDGLREAFSWFMGHGKGAEALELAAGLWEFQQERGHADESRVWLAEALAAPGAEPRTRTRAQALYGAGILAFRKQDEEAATRSFEEALAIAREVDDVNWIVRTNTGLARVALRRGDANEIRKWSSEALTVARTRGEKGDAANPLHMLAAAARIEGDHATAKSFYRQNLALNRELQRSKWVSSELGNLGALEVMDGNIDEAEPLIRESLQMAHDRGDAYMAPYGLIWLGRVAFARGDAERAAKLLAAARAQFDATGLAMDPDEAPEYEKGLAAIQAAMDGERFAAAWDEGKRMSLDAAVIFALGPKPPPKGRK